MSKRVNAGQSVWPSARTLALSASAAHSMRPSLFALTAPSRPSTVGLVASQQDAMQPFYGGSHGPSWSTQAITADPLRTIRTDPTLRSRRSTHYQDDESDRKSGSWIVWVLCVFPCLERDAH
mmetsp:Transcript_72783/g.168712  ORF Transcript_72783/g.168712 Transcript_72783/m.168712 type:complete len:122 (+) Transcript_72783:177-542(+)